MAEDTGGKDDPTAEAAAEGARASRAKASASRKARTTKKKSTASPKKTSGTSRTRSAKASGATAARSRSKRPAAKEKSATAAAAGEQTADARASATRSEAPETASGPQTGGVETVARRWDELWRALGIIGFGTVSLGLVGLAALGGLAQSVMRVSRPERIPPLTGFQKGVAAYLRQIVDYLAAPDTAADLPFPFSDFPSGEPSEEEERQGTDKT